MVRRLVEPNQVDTSNEYGGILSPVALRQLRESWQHLFRRVILELLPANALAAHFHDVMGRPTKELYSVAKKFMANLRGIFAALAWLANRISNQAKRMHWNACGELNKVINFASRKCHFNNENAC